MSHLMYDLLDGLQEGIHAYLDTHPDTEPQTLLVKIEITDDEVTVFRSNLGENMTKLMDGYKERLAEIRSEVQSRRIMNPAHSLEQEKMKLEAKLVLLSVLMSELENDVDSYHE